MMLKKILAIAAIGIATAACAVTADRSYVDRQDAAVLSNATAFAESLAATNAAAIVDVRGRAETNTATLAELLPIVATNSADAARLSATKRDWSDLEYFTVETNSYTNLVVKRTGLASGEWGNFDGYVGQVWTKDLTATNDLWYQMIDSPDLCPRIVRNGEFYILDRWDGYGSSGYISDSQFMNGELVFEMGEQPEGGGLVLVKELVFEESPVVTFTTNRHTFAFADEKRDSTDRVWTAAGIPESGTGYFIVKRLQDGLQKRLEWGDNGYLTAWIENPGGDTIKWAVEHLNGDWLFWTDIDNYYYILPDETGRYLITVDSSQYLIQGYTTSDTFALTSEVTNAIASIDLSPYYTASQVDRMLDNFATIVTNLAARGFIQVGTNGEAYAAIDGAFTNKTTVINFIKGE